MVIPKEKQTAFQRWEMTSFSDGDHGVNQKDKKQASPYSEAISKEIENARREGYKIGLQQGFDTGLLDAKQHAQQEKDKFVNILNGLAQAIQTAEDTIAQDILSVAMDIAKAMVKQKIAVDPTVMLPIVKEAIHYLPYVQQPARILVHPADAKILHQYLQDDLNDFKWQVHEDASIERGGCMVETGANQIDASNSTRWKRISDALAQQSDWLVP